MIPVEFKSLLRSNSEEEKTTIEIDNLILKEVKSYIDKNLHFFSPFDYRLSNGHKSIVKTHTFFYNDIEQYSGWKSFDTESESWIIMVPAVYVDGGERRHNTFVELYFERMKSLSYCSIKFDMIRSFLDENRPLNPSGASNLKNLRISLEMLGRDRRKLCKRLKSYTAKKTRNLKLESLLES